MKCRALSVICVVLMSFAAFEGQTSYSGLTPGKSTRAEAERVMGQPVKNVSKTLAEYSPPKDIGKLYVQYRDGSPTAVVERIELICQLEPKPFQGGCSNPKLKLYGLPDIGGIHLRADAMIRSRADDSGNRKDLFYFGSPVFVVRTDTSKAGLTHLRVGFFSRELYLSEVPKGCSGLFYGVWETNRGRMTITATPPTSVPESSGVYPWDTDTKGTYSTNNGSITAHDSGNNRLIGEWKDDTGSGTMELTMANDEYTAFSGTWKRKSGKGPREGTWEGRCVPDEQ